MKCIDLSDEYMGKKKGGVVVNRLGQLYNEWASYCLTFTFLQTLQKEIPN